MDILKRSLAVERPTVGSRSPSARCVANSCIAERCLVKTSKNPKSCLTSLMRSRTETLDCLIIGGGPAGLLAAIYFGRYRRHIQVIDAGESRSCQNSAEPQLSRVLWDSGPELLARLRAEAEEYGVLTTGGRITSLRKEGRIFIASGPHIEMQANFVLLAHRAR